MRLIDADALLEDAAEVCEDYGDGYCEFGYSHKQIQEAPTIDHAYGFPLEHLALIARVIEKEGVTPGEVAGLLRDAGKISKMVVDVVQKVYKKFMQEAVRRIDDDPSHPFADDVMMKE